MKRKEEKEKEVNKRELRATENIPPWGQESIYCRKFDKNRYIRLFQKLNSTYDL